jgi:hypothetical protein
MKKYFSLFLIVLSVSLFGQNHFIGAKGGIAIVNVSDALFNVPSMRTSFTGGFSYEYQMKNNFLIGSDLLYIEKGYSTDITMTNDEGITQGTAAINFHFNYISLPLKAGYTFGNKLSGFVYVGLVPALLTNAYYKGSDPNGILDDTGSFPKISAKEYTSKFELSALAEIGADYKISDSFLLTTAIASQYGITPVSNYENHENNMRNIGFFFTFGLKYALSQN